MCVPADMVSVFLLHGGLWRLALRFFATLEHYYFGYPGE